MRKRAAILLVLLITTALFSACTSGNLVQLDAEGVGTGKKGDIFRTDRLEVRLTAVQATKSAGGYTARDKEQLIDLTVQLKNITEEDVTVYDTDFQLTWGTEGFADPLVAATDETMAPAEITLAPGEKAEYHYVYPAPEGVTNYALCFADAYPAEGSADVQGIYYAQFSL